MTTIVTRAGKGTLLTNNELDSNFVNLNNNKVEQSSKGSENTGVFYYNARVVSASVAIAATENVMSAGPITIADGVTVTIDDGGEWTIV